jgi:hypothetical protein
MMSQEHLRNYITTGDLTENEKSLELLSDSLKFELEAFNAFSSVAKNDTSIQNNNNNNNMENINNATTAAIPGI